LIAVAFEDAIASRLAPTGFVIDTDPCRSGLAREEALKDSK
jgi:hypothetical protein